MSQIRNLIISAPRIAGVKDHEQFSFIATNIFDADAAKLTELFDRKPGWSISARIRFMFLWMFSEDHNDYIGDLLFSLAVFAAQSIDINNGILERTSEYESEAIRLTETLKSYPKITSIMTVQEARALLGWAPGVAT